MNKRIINMHNLQEKWEDFESNISGTPSESNFDSVLFPVVRKVFSTTLGPSDRDIDKIKNRLKSENRDGKIESLIKGEKYTEKKLEDDEEYKKSIKDNLVQVKPMSAPISNLFYIDYKYDDKDKK